MRRGATRPDDSFSGSVGASADLIAMILTGVASIPFLFLPGIPCEAQRLLYLAPGTPIAALSGGRPLRAWMRGSPGRCPARSRAASGSR